MQNNIRIFCIKEAWNKCLAKITLYRIKEKKCISHQHPNPNNNLGLSELISDIIMWYALVFYNCLYYGFR